MTEMHPSNYATVRPDGSSNIQKKERKKNEPKEKRNKKYIRKHKEKKEARI